MPMIWTDDLTDRIVRAVRGEVPRRVSVETELFVWLVLGGSVLAALIIAAVLKVWR